MTRINESSSKSARETEVNKTLRSTMRPAGALPSASRIAPVNCAALHVDRITNGQHHDPVDPAFLHLESVLLRTAESVGVAG